MVFFGGNMKAIGEIKEEFKSIKDGDLAGFKSFAESYVTDGRKGVAALCNRALKQIRLFQEEEKRTETMYAFEDKFTAEGYTAICGIDEVGRGPLAGPVVACAVILPTDHRILYLNDSKQVKKEKREELYEIITREAVSYGVGIVSESVIDEINILQATYEAMRQAISKLKPAPELTLNDAVKIPQVNARQIPIIKGDTLSASIAAASIVAKVTRDRMMEEYDKVYPGYGFASNVGYGSAEHIKAIKSQGPSPIHRMTFIKKFL